MKSPESKKEIFENQTMRMYEVRMKSSDDLISEMKKVEQHKFT